MFWKNPDILFICNSRITEYDIKSGNTSIMKAFHLATPERIAEIESMKKEDRVVAVGNMSKNSNFAKALEDGFNQIVREFCETNGLRTSDDVIDIYRDAVFVIAKQPQNTVIRDVCHFIPKNEYVGYLRCKNFEFFIGEDKIDVKGLNDYLIPLHEDGILALIRKIYDVCVEVHMDPVQINLFMKDVIKQYTDLDFVNEVYREFNTSSKYKVSYGENDFLMDHITDADLDHLDISYNYLHILIPIIKVIC